MLFYLNRDGKISIGLSFVNSGARDGQIHHHDVRIAHHHVGSYIGHTQEVCGLQWSFDGRYLASGGNDNLLNIWGNDVSQLNGEASPLHSFRHQAAVKVRTLLPIPFDRFNRCMTSSLLFPHQAVSWCPWESNVLASGGGTADRTIRLWNCNSGACLNTVDAKSQVGVASSKLSPSRKCRAVL